MSENTNEKLTIEDLKKGSDNYCERAIKDYLGKLGFSEAVASPFREGQYNLFSTMTSEPVDISAPWEGGWYCQVVSPDIGEKGGGILPLKENLTLVEHFSDYGSRSNFEIFHEPVERVCEAFNIEVENTLEGNGKRLAAAIDLMHAANKNIGHFMDRAEIASTLEGKELEASQHALIHLCVARNIRDGEGEKVMPDLIGDWEQYLAGFAEDYDLSNVMDSLKLTGDLPKEQQAEKIAEVVSLAVFTEKDPYLIVDALDDRGIDISYEQMKDLFDEICVGDKLAPQDVLDAVPELGQAKDNEKGGR